MKSDIEPNLDPAKLPRHLAVIMDGNGRWAKKKGWLRVRGHEEGAESVRVIVRTCRKLGIGALTLYAFSEENWARPKAEVAALMGLLKRFLKSEKDEMVQNGIRLYTIGDTSKLPQDVQDTLAETKEATKNGKGMSLNLALSYGGRQEIIRAVRLLAEQVLRGDLSPEDITEQAVASRLYTAHLPDPDLLIRTSGEQRISNFLPWQTAYSEFYFTPVYWPEFREPELYEALEAFAGRQRRFGKTGEQVEKR